MLCLSGFELYSRWVPLIGGVAKCRLFAQARGVLKVNVFCRLSNARSVIARPR